MLKAISYSSIFIGLAAFSLSLFHGLESGSIVIARSILIGLATFASYNITQLAPLRLRDPLTPRGWWLKKHSKTLWRMSLIALAMITLLSTQLSLYDWINFSHLFVLSLVYENTFGNTPMRKIPYIKPFWISYIWAMSCALPYAYDSKNWSLLWQTLECFLFILSLCVVFDIRDKFDDLTNDTKTFATKLSLKNVKLISFLIFVAAFAFLIGLYKINLIGAIIFALTYMAILWVAKPNSKESLYLVGVDGLIILKLLLLPAVWQ